MRPDLPTGTVTFLFTDVEGSTRLLHELGAEAYAAALAEHRRVVREACAAEGGVEVDTQGDAFFFAFPSAPGALAAAATFTDALASGPIRVRVGLHTGTPLLTEEGYVGDDVHFAARVASAGHGGQVLLSSSTTALLGCLRGSEGASLNDLGEHRLKDIADPVTLFQLGGSGFPPLKTISNTNLPRPASSFVGRERELSELISRIEGGARLLTLTGPGGSGKTRLALEAAASLVPEYKAGVFWVGLASLRDPTLVIDTIAQTLGAKDGLVDHIGERELLLLLDNLEHVIDAAPELASLVQSCHYLTLLVTSRELLRVQGELEYPIPPLTAPEAVKLFCERSRLEPTTEVGAICARVDSLPLAVELAAARANVLSPRQILERLSERLDLLKGGRDADPRQRTLRATIDWSYDLLSDDEQRLFRALSVFSGGCSLEAAEEVCDADLDSLQSLVEKSLLRFSNERYWMLETIGEYAGERLGESTGDLPALRRRHSSYALRVAEEHPQEYDLLELEQANMRLALSFLHQEGLPDELRLVGALSDFWLLRGHLREGRQHVEAALRRHTAPTELRFDVLRHATDFARPLGDLSGAVAHANEALDLARTLGDTGRVGLAYHELGECAVASGEHEKAAGLYQEAIAAARSAGESGARSIANLADLALVQGDYERAAVLASEAIELAHRDGAEEGVAVASFNLGSAHLQLGNFEEASKRLGESLRLAQKLGFRDLLAACLVVVAEFAVETRRDAVAARLVRAADDVVDEQGSVLDPAEARLRESVIDHLSESGLSTEFHHIELAEAVELAFETLNDAAYRDPALDAQRAGD